MRKMYASLGIELIRTGVIRTFPFFFVEAFGARYVPLRLSKDPHALCDWLKAKFTDRSYVRRWPPAAACNRWQIRRS